MTTKKRKKAGGLEPMDIGEMVVAIAAASGGAVKPEQIKKAMEDHGLGRKRKLSVIDYAAHILQKL